MPCSRQISFTDKPDSCCFKIAIICDSLNFELFILPHFTNSIFKRFVFWGSLPYNGQFYKSINTDFHPSPNPQLIDDYATLNLDHRYSKVGESGYYVSQTNTGNLTEMGFLNGVPANYQRYRYDNVSINNMLYLTDDAVRQQLGITDDMIKKLGEGKYEYTHILGTWAKDHYKGIVYPGAQGGNYTNIIIFKQVDVDNALGGLIANPF